MYLNDERRDLFLPLAATGMPEGAVRKLQALGITTLEELRDTWTYGNRQLLTDYLGESPVRFVMVPAGRDADEVRGGDGAGGEHQPGGGGAGPAAGPARAGAGAPGVAAQAAGRGATGHRPRRSAREPGGDGPVSLIDGSRRPGTRASAARAWRSPRWLIWSSISPGGRRGRSGGRSSSSTGRARRSTARRRRGRPSPRLARP